MWEQDGDGNFIKDLNGAKKLDFKKYDEFLTELSSSEMLHQTNELEPRSCFNKLIEKIKTKNNWRLIYEYANGKSLHDLLDYYAQNTTEVIKYETAINIVE